jgi:hypothetical protein
MVILGHCQLPWRCIPQNDFRRCIETALYLIPIEIRYERWRNGALGALLQHVALSRTRPAARTIARMPARIGSERVAQASISSAKPGSIVARAPDSAPPSAERADFLGVWGVVRIPLPPLYGNKELRGKLGSRPTPKPTPPTRIQRRSPFGMQRHPLIFLALDDIGRQDDAAGVQVEPAAMGPSGPIASGRLPTVSGRRTSRTSSASCTYGSAKKTRIQRRCSPRRQRGRRAARHAVGARVEPALPIRSAADNPGSAPFETVLVGRG